MWESFTEREERAIKRETFRRFLGWGGWLNLICAWHLWDQMSDCPSNQLDCARWVTWPGMFIPCFFKMNRNYKFHKGRIHLGSEKVKDKKNYTSLSLAKIKNTEPSPFLDPLFTPYNFRTAELQQRFITACSYTLLRWLVFSKLSLAVVVRCRLLAICYD